MTKEHHSEDPSAADTFARHAEQKSTGLTREFWDFLRYNRKWWLTPIILMLLLMGLLLVVNTTAVGPFIYALF